MKAPLLLIRAPDDWLATQLRDWAADRKWVVRAANQWGAFAAAVAPRRPCVAFLQAELTADAWAVALADLHRRQKAMRVFRQAPGKRGAMMPLAFQHGQPGTV